MADEVIFVRHAKSTGNLASDESRKGNHALFSRELRRQKSWQWPLTPTGIAHSKETGRRIRKRICQSFDEHFSSPYPRTLQTAQHLGFTNAVWRQEELLRERHWGGCENLPYPERCAVFARAGISLTEDSMTWRPPNGESMVELLERARAFLHLLPQQGRVLVVTHGGPIQAFRVLQHEITPAQYPNFISGNNYIRNCHIFHYFEKKAGNAGFPRYRFERSLYTEADGSWTETITELN